MTDARLPPTATRDRRPLGVQVYGAIRDQIATGDFAAGARLPSESILAETFGVSRVTVREALRLLQQDMLIHSVHGRGHFVLASTQLVETPVTELESVTELMDGRGYSVETRVVSMEEVPAADSADALEVDREEPVIVLERVRSTEGTPMIYSIDVFPARYGAGAADTLSEGGSLLEMFAARDLDIAYSKTAISAAVLPRKAVRAAPFPKIPFVLMEQTNFTGEHVPVLYSLDYHRGDKFKFSVVRTRRTG